jgi:hypothetical protein
MRSSTCSTTVLSARCPSSTGAAFQGTVFVPATPVALRSACPSSILVVERVDVVTGTGGAVYGVDATGEMAVFHGPRLLARFRANDALIENRTKAAAFT